MNETFFRKIAIIIILAILAVLSFFLLKPLLLSIIFGIILAFIFTPVYNWLYKKIKSKNLSAIIICILLLTLIVLPIWFLIPIAVQESIKLYTASQKIDYSSLIEHFLPAFKVSEQFSAEIGSALHSFVTKLTNSLMNSLSNLIFNFPTLVLRFIVVIFVFFFVLRDKEEFILYIKEIFPFSKEIEKKFFASTKQITSSILYGQILIGAIQGLVLGAGLFIFKSPNPLLLTLFSVIVGILPIVGPAIVWVPLSIYFFISGNNLPAIGIIAFGLISLFSDNLLKPIFVSRRAEIHPGIVLIGMIGGLFLFGVLGLIIGPLILAYLIIMLEFYKGKKSSILIGNHKD